MRTWGVPGAATIRTIACVTPGLGDDDRGGRWWRGEWKEEFWNGPCEVKLESKDEVKCDRR
jgi:hypothetical protein